MMAGACFERVRATGAAHAARRAADARRSFVMRLVGQNIRRTGIGMFLPCSRKFYQIALRAVAAEEFAVAADAGLDEVFRSLLENRPPLLAVAREQRRAAPTVERRRKFPTEIDDIVEPIVEAIGAIRRMRMRGIAGDEDATRLVSLGDRDAQIPETDIVEMTG